MGQVNEDDGLDGFWGRLASRCEGPWAVLWVPLAVVVLVVVLGLLGLFGLLVTVWDWIRGDTSRWKRAGEWYRATERAERTERAESTESDERSERA